MAVLRSMPAGDRANEGMALHDACVTLPRILGDRGDPVP